MKGNNTNNFDQLIKAKLENHVVAPPTSVRASFISSVQQTNAWYQKPAYWSVAALLLVCFLSCYLFIDLSPSLTQSSSLSSNSNKDINKSVSTEEHSQAISSQLEPEKSKSIDVKEVSSPAISLQSEQANSRSKESLKEINQTAKGSLTSKGVMKDKPGLIANDFGSDEAAIQNSNKKLQDNKNNTSSGLITLDVDQKNIRDFGFISALNRRGKTLFEGYTLQLNYRKSKQANIFKFKEDDASRGFSFPKNKFYLGVSYTPEWMFNTVEEDKKLIHNAALEFQYCWNDFIIRTGIGISKATGTSEFSVDYREYLGHYTKLDSTSYVWNSTQEKVEAVYHLSDFKVFDTARMYAKQAIEKEYTYLQIPLIFGYDFYKRSRIFLGVRTGPILSVLLKTTEKGDIDPGDNKIISINNLSPDRVNTNWQFTGGLVFGYHLTKSFRLEAEPRLKYYFNSVYEKNATIRKPWSFEARMALVYGF